MSTSEIKYIRDSVEQQIRKSSNVFLIGHKGPDFDSIGACMGMYELANALGKKAYIIVDEEIPEDEETKIEPGAKKVIEENREKYQIIKPENVKFHLKERSILFVLDTNKKKKVSISNSLDMFKNVIILDHHMPDDNTIETPYTYISEDVSSASEMVARILFASRTKYTAAAASALLAGIRLDTQRFGMNTSSKTHDVAEKLIDNGANTEYVNSLFLEEFESFKRIGNLIINGTILKKYNDSTLYPYQVSFTLNRTEPHTIYFKEDFAKAANRMMEFNEMDASFALGYVDEKNVHVSARSGKRINVGKFMEEFQGGGNAHMAGTRIATDDLLGLEEQMIEKLGQFISNQECIQEEKTIQKVKKN